MITPAQLTRIFPKADAGTWAPAINRAWERWGITGLNARAGFLGITGNETGGYTKFSENMNYSARRLLEVFPRRINGMVHAEVLVAAGHQAIANRIYSGKYIGLGNGDEVSGDGWRFRGRGVVQLTGRANYRAAGAALGLDLEGNPDLVLEPDTAAQVAAWFMVAYAKILPKLDKPDEATFLEAAKKVGSPPDSAATQRRLEYRRLALSVLRDSVTSGGAASVARPAPPPTREQMEPQRGTGHWFESLIAALLAAARAAGRIFKRST